MAHVATKAPALTLDNDIEELILQAAEVIFDECAVGYASLDLLEMLDEQYGDRGLAKFVRSAIQYCHNTHIYDNRKPRPLNEKTVKKEIIERVDEEVNRQFRQDRILELQAAHVCEHCKKIRHGKKWMKGRVSPDKAIVADICPSCEKKGLL